MLAKLFVGLQYILPKHLLTALIYRISRSEINWWKNLAIKNFIKAYNIDMQDYGNTNQHDYASFNKFFTRAINPSARPIVIEKNVLASPVDGRVSQAGPIKSGRIIQAKGFDYSVRQLLGDSKWASNYTEGEFSTIYLAPFNYHRIHMPCDGLLKKMRYIPGKLYSVNQATTENLENLFAKNERVICEFETTHGLLSMVLVGALFVGSIETTWAKEITPNKNRVIQDFNYSDNPIYLKRGEEMGRFNMGSTVILLSENSNIHFEKIDKSVMLGEQIARIATD